MIFDIGILFVALIIIVASAELFTNGIEWLGQRLELSEGVVGSVLAAVGTALPETLIPIVAVCFFGGQHGAEVGIGAIAGAPFMLSTLTLGLCGLSAFYFARAGRRPKELKLNTDVLGRDLRFFMLAYFLALAVSFTPSDPILRYVLAFLIFLIYPVYLYKTFSSQGEMGEEPGPLYLTKIVRLDSRKLRLIIPQVVIALAGIVGGAYIFVEFIQKIALDIGFPPLVLSLIVSPIATELPEKINSVLWARNGKDTLALGNVTGALVFQSCIPVAFGIGFTKWNLDLGTLLTGVVAISSALVWFLFLRKKKLTSSLLMFGAIVYVIAVAMLINLDIPN
ncbi:MAG: sodium:calcium antiporter, partial [Candidatus Obscuribacterales bacterium]|nr:sodium:calcium antiporter [Candidatus Obscuribacterales bacterium]